MEEKVYPSVRITIVAVLLAMFALIVASPVSAAGTCLLPSFECQNSTYNTKLGTNDYGEITQDACESIGGTYDPENNVNSISWCQAGCCCPTGPGTPAPPTIQLACGPGTRFATLNPPTDQTCLQTCSAPIPPPEQPACGVGAITASDVAAECLCGTTEATQEGAFCCWDGTIASSQATCSLPSNACTVNQIATQWCTCGGVAIKDQACCPGGTTAATVGACSTPPPQNAACGNNVKEGNEQCDALYAWDVQQQKYIFSSGIACTAATDFCTSQCSCVAQPTQGICGNNICDASETSESCSQDCPLPPSCAAGTKGYPAPSADDPIYAAVDPSNPTITLNWTLTAQCDAARTGFIIQRSTKGIQQAISNPDFVSSQLDRDATSYVDLLPVQVISNSTTVYYAISAIYRTDTGATGLGTTTKQVDIPSTICPQANSAYCLSSDKAVNCQNFKPTYTDCPNTGANPYVCSVQTGPNANIAYCLPQSTECETCNGVLEGFADDNMLIREFYNTNSQVNNRLRCEAAATCYKDLRTSSLEMYLYCSNIDSCTGYRTQDACESNVCTKPGGCNWQPLGTDIKSGICRSAEPIFQDCSQCNALGSACTRTTCEAISTTGSCYYYEPGEGYSESDSNDPVCLNKKDVPCEFLTTQQACEGGQAFSLDVTYQNGARIAGDHSTIRESADILGHGKCTWFTDNTGSYCAKDSDDSGLADRREIDPRVELPPLLRDFTSPVSTVVGVPSKLYPRFFSVPVLNDSTLYVAFCEEGNNSCYPRAATAYSNGKVTKTFKTSESGNWELRYYSEDQSRNLEPVGVFPFTIDSLPPSITITAKTLTPYVQSQNVMVTAAYVAFSVNEPSYCKTLLLSDTATSQTPVPYQVRGVSELGEAPAVTGPFGTSFSITYPKLPDGRYFLNITCTDQNGNSNTPAVSEAVVVDSDPTINSPSPVSNIPTNDVAMSISIKTNSSALCRYTVRSAQLPPFASMTPYSTTGGTTHSASVPVSSGNYTFITACDVNGQVIYGSQQDDIKFLIDQQAPSTQVCSRVAGTDSASCVPAVISPANKVNNYQLTLRCIDNPANPQAGCDYRENIFSCVYRQGEPACTPEQEYDVPDIGGTGIYHLVYYSIDKAGNREPQKDIAIQPYDTSPPTRPSFSITP